MVEWVANEQPEGEALPTGRTCDVELILGEKLEQMPLDTFKRALELITLAPVN